jgi:hypothetical protein
VNSQKIRHGRAERSEDPGHPLPLCSQKNLIADIEAMDGRDERPARTTFR